MMLLYRTVLLLVGGGGLIVGVLLLFVLTMTWTNSERLRPVSDHQVLVGSLQEAYWRLRSESERGELPPSERDSLAATLRELAALPIALAPSTAAELTRAAESLETRNPVSVAEVRERIGAVLEAEGYAQRTLLAELQEDNQREFQAALALAVILPALSLALLVFFHYRVLAPVNDLSGFLALLARKDYAVAASDNVDPLVRPLFEKYNRMVKRMHDLEQGHQKREDSLRQDVDQATRALFQQQAALARMERLAAVGEVSARLGHELRNPLSGVLMALTNLREEVDSEDQDQRLGLVIAELERIAHLLTRVVEESRQVPERPRVLRLRAVVEEMASLMRYQLDDEVTLETDVPEDLLCILPESGLRHALLNLVLNAAQALQGRGGTVRIRAERQSNERVAINVSDDGPGFPEELLRAGVHEFGSWRRGGTGLGLATVQRFAVANTGQLQLVNRAEGGACASLMLNDQTVAA
jgi:signal transduction histidine kinase